MIKKTIYIVVLVLIGGTSLPLAASGMPVPEADTSLQIATASWEVQAEMKLWDDAVVERAFTNDPAPVHVYSIRGYHKLKQLRTTMFRTITAEQRHAGKREIATSASVFAKKVLSDLARVDAAFQLTDTEHLLLSEINESYLASLPQNAVATGPYPDTHKITVLSVLSSATSQREFKPGIRSHKKQTVFQTAHLVNVTVRESSLVPVDYYTLFLYIWEDNPERDRSVISILPCRVFPNNTSRITTHCSSHITTHFTTPHHTIIQGVLI